MEVDWKELSVEEKLDGGSGAGDTELRPVLGDDDGGRRSEKRADDGVDWDVKGGADEGGGGSGERERTGENESPNPFAPLLTPTIESPKPVEPFDNDGFDSQAVGDPAAPASKARNRSPVDVEAATGTTAFGRVGRPRRIGEMLTLRSGRGPGACDPVVMMPE